VALDDDTPTGCGGDECGATVFAQNQPMVAMMGGELKEDMLRKRC
jgi:hypothetical protein